MLGAISMRSVQQKLALLLTVLAASGCGLPSRTSNALQSVTRTAPAADEADSAAQNRELLAGLRVGAGGSGYQPVSEMQAPATLARSVARAPETGLVLAEPSEIKARLDRIRERAAAKPRTEKSDRKQDARPVILVSNAERRRAKLESESTAEWAVEEVRPESEQRARARTESPKRNTVQAPKRGSAWFDTSKDESMTSGWSGSAHR